MTMMATIPPVILGSALGAFNGEQKWVDTVLKLMEEVDTG